MAGTYARIRRDWTLRPILVGVVVIAVALVVTAIFSFGAFGVRDHNRGEGAGSATGGGGPGAPSNWQPTYGSLTFV